MVHLTSFKLYSTLPGEVTIRQLLDFFEGVPRLHKILLYLTTPDSSAQNGRLVSLACLEWMEITSGGSASLLLDHMLIPVGADSTIEVDLHSPPIKDHPPRFLDNLKNFPNFTTIELCGVAHRFRVVYNQGFLGSGQYLWWPIGEDSMGKLTHGTVGKRGIEA
jgi:hypothetical protein